MEVKRCITWHILGATKVVTSELCWRTSDPAAIHIVFNDPDVEKPRPWVFGRSILTAAMATGHGGEMDVTASRGKLGMTHGRKMLIEHRFGDILWLYLNSPDGLVVLICEAKEIDVFLHHTYAQIPNGHETDSYLDTIDEEIESLFGE